ncbi:hypothetical protein AWC38_SpisGene5682 [Stylophora pistillata]|uniref:SGNH hydrolase-type esterase domain-containing protein n=1 Tax=Stylophora pistillata TaxID=50429 RepID=A0A2B4SM16_STYPI|nr:hypothetical protein AWC38_SpisGene5682 [Stylophora pistillata]
MIAANLTFTLSQVGQLGFQPFSDKLSRGEYNALKHSVERDPYEVWYHKDNYKSLGDMSITPEVYVKETVERASTTHRLNYAMAKVLRGKNIGLVVMGGSISAGGGIMSDFSDLRGIYYRVFIDWWQKAVQPFTGSVITLQNMALGGTASNFFSFCYRTLMSPGNTIDIVLLEFSVNDYIVFKDSRHPRALSLENLSRQLLSEKSFPAVMFVNFIGGNNAIPVCDNLENHGQTMLAKHYGITSVSTRQSLCPNFGTEVSSMFSSDHNHAGILAHAQIAMMIIDIFRKALLKAIESSKQNLQSHSSLYMLPKSVFFTEDTNPLPDPLCYSLITPDITKRFFRPSLYVREIGKMGFTKIRGIAIGYRKETVVQINPGPVRNDGYDGWKAESAHSTLRLRFFVPISRSEISNTVVIAFRTTSEGGKAKVWLDNDEAGVMVDTVSHFGHTRLVPVANHVTFGSHVLNFKTVNDGKFVLCGVMLGAKNHLTSEMN